MNDHCYTLHLYYIRAFGVIITEKACPRSRVPYGLLKLKKIDDKCDFKNKFFLKINTIQLHGYWILFVWIAFYFFSPFGSLLALRSYHFQKFFIHENVNIFHYSGTIVTSVGFEFGREKWKRGVMAITTTRFHRHFQNHTPNKVSKKSKWNTNSAYFSQPMTWKIKSQQKKNRI